MDHLAPLAEHLLEEAIAGGREQLDRGAARLDERGPPHLLAVLLALAPDHLAGLIGIEHLQQRAPFLNRCVEVLDEHRHVVESQIRHNGLLGTGERVQPSGCSMSSISAPPAAAGSRNEMRLPCEPGRGVLSRIGTPAALSSSSRESRPWTSIATW